MRRIFHGLLPVLMFSVMIGSAQASLIYDFGAPGAAALNGINNGTFVAGGVPLTVSSGTMDQTGTFALGASNATMFVGTVTFMSDPPAAGLGVNSDIASGAIVEDPLSRQEGLVFDFAASFEPGKVVVHHFGSFIGELRLFVDDAFFGDVPTVTGDNSILLPGGISKLAMTPHLGTGLSSDPIYLVSRIVAIPEPATRTLLVIALVGLAFVMRRGRKA